jgi:uncharacterized membrane protein
MESKKTWHEQEMQDRTWGERLADAISAAAGSWGFLLLHGVWFFVWIYFRVEAFPFGLLTMIVSLEAIFLSTFILISQNRATARDRAQAAADYETNLAAKEEIEALMKRLDAIEQNKLDKILAMLEKDN